MRIMNKAQVLVRSHLVNYPTPASLNYFWGFGGVAGLFLFVQIISGLILSMHYSNEAAISFASIEYIMRSVNNGWLIRYTHSNGASVFLFILYAHIARGLYFRSFVGRGFVWCSGVLIFVLVVATAFFGYVLPWGQMSFWAATVITNLVSAIPIIGVDLLYWFWGGYSVDSVTLTRFFSLHFLLPFVIAGLAIVHVAALHKVGSSNPLAVENADDYIPFYPYFFLKDALLFLIFCFILGWFVFFYPNALSHPDNSIKANPLTTPASIVPEWYFLPFYAILRAIPTKGGGVFCLASSILVLFILPAFKVREPALRSPWINECYVIVYATWVLTFILLGWLGGAPMEYPYVWLSRFFVVYHFFFFSIYIPILDPIVVDVAYHNTDYESYMPTPEEEEAEHYEHITVNIYVIERMPKIAEKD